MAREQGVPLMFTIAQSSYWAALHLGDAGLESMKQRGSIQIGKIADITIFNPETITDNSTFKIGENGIPTTGIPYVIVNGVTVVKNNEVLPVNAGQEIRFPVEAKGRFTPIDKEDWRMKHTIGVNPDLSKFILMMTLVQGHCLIKKNKLITKVYNMKKSLLTLFITALLFSSCNETATKKGADPNQEFDWSS